MFPLEESQNFKTRKETTDLKYIITSQNQTPSTYTNAYFHGTSTRTTNHAFYASVMLSFGTSTTNISTTQMRVRCAAVIFQVHTTRETKDTPPPLIPPKGAARQVWEIFRGRKL